MRYTNITDRERFNETSMTFDDKLHSIYKYPMIYSDLSSWLNLNLEELLFLLKNRSTKTKILLINLRIVHRKWLNLRTIITKRKSPKLHPHYLRHWQLNLSATPKYFKIATRRLKPTSNWPKQHSYSLKIEITLNKSTIF